LASEHEITLAKLFLEKKKILDELKKDPEANKYKIQTLSTELESLQSLMENYNLGMNVFRKAAGRHSETTKDDLLASAKVSGFRK
jgi:colicin import membrane protein